MGMARGHVSGDTESCPNNCPLLSQGGTNKRGEHGPCSHRLTGRTDISSTDYSQTTINHAIKLLPSSSRTEIREMASAKRDDKAFTLGFKR